MILAQNNQGSADATHAGPDLQIEATTSTLLSSLLELLDPGIDATAVNWSYSFPSDHHAHPAQGAESWTLFFTFETSPENQMALQAGFARVRLHSATPLESRHSSWSFDRLFGFSANVAELATAKHREVAALSRSALELAGTDSGTGSVWVNQYGMRLRSVEACELEVSLDIPDHVAALQLTAKSNLCPLHASSPSLIHGYSVALTKGVGTFGDLQITAGRGWLLRNWGELPSTASPVVLDQFRLLLDDGLLHLTRSRRRDGRGTPVLSATWHGYDDLRELDHRLLSLQDKDYWLSATSRQRYSAGWDLSWPGFTAVIEPLVPEQEQDVLGQKQWSGVVRVTVQNNSDAAATRSEHVGFAELSPVTASVQQ